VSKTSVEYLTDLTKGLEPDLIIRSCGTHTFYVESLGVEIEFDTESELEELVSAVKLIKSKTC
jgi:hypothetical protein